MREFLPVVVLTLAEGGSRLLSFAYYLLAARVLAPEGFGVFRYTVTLAVLAFAGVQVLAMTMNRELGSARADRNRIQEVLGTGLVSAAALFVVSAGLAALAASAGFTGSANTLGLLAVLAGLTVFETYYAIGRGLGEVKRMAFTYVGTTLTQLLTFTVLILAFDPSTTVVLLLFAASSLVSVAVIELFRPIVRGKAVVVTWDAFRRISLLAASLLVAHALYIIWASADQIWIENKLGTREVGIYGAARNLAQVFLVLPSAMYGVMMPRLAELRSAGDDVRARQLAYTATASVMILSALLATVIILIRSPLLDFLYGSEYRQAAPSLLALSIAMVIYGGFVTLTTTAVGWGRPAVYTVGIALAMLGELAYLAVFGDDQASTAAWAYAASISLGFAVVLGWLVLRPLKEPAKPASGGV